MSYYEEQITPSQHSNQPGGVDFVDPMHLDLDDDVLAKVIDDNIADSVTFYDAMNLVRRQKANWDYYLGRQDIPKKKKKSHTGYKENLVFEGISRIKPIALSRMPDITVKAGNDSKDSKETSEDLTDIFNSELKARENRFLYGLLHKLEPIWFFSCMKMRWNPETGDHGDYESVSVHPKKIRFDHRVITANADHMRFVAELDDNMTVKDAVMMFPEKEKELLEKVGIEKNEDDPEKRLATPIDVWEVWFHWYKKKKDEVTGQIKWEKIDGVVWKYGDLILKKMKNPYFDYQGYDRYFKKEMDEKRPATEQEIYDMFDSEEDNGVFKDTVYANYFKDPRKPYFFFVYENMGEHPIDVTTRVEQIQEFQDGVNITGANIQDMNFRSRGKDLFDTNAIEQETIDQIDIYDVDQVLGIDVPPGKSIRDSHARIEQVPATPQMYNSMQDNRQKAFEIMGVGATTRGLRENDSTLGQDQMSREADYGLIDDIVEDTINAGAEWQSQWSMQMIKMFYTKPHMRHLMGKDGEVLHTKLSRDMIEDGMEAVVSASGVDKMMRKRMAVENVNVGFGDPLSYFTDTDQDNPRERAKRAMLFNVSPMMYMQEYIMEELSEDNPQMPGMPTDQPPVAQPPAQQPPRGGGQPYTWQKQ